MTWANWSGFFLLFSEILCSSHPTFDLNFRRCLISTGNPSLTRGSWGGSTQTVGATFYFWLNRPNICKVFVLGKSISWDAQMSDIMMWLKIGWKGKIYVCHWRYPKIFDDETVGAEAKKLYKEAEVRLLSFAERKKQAGKTIQKLYYHKF